MENRNKIVLSAVSAAILSAIAQSAVTKFDASSATKAVNWIESIIGEAAFPWVACFILTVTALVWFWPFVEQIMNPSVINIHIEEMGCKSTRHSKDPYVSSRTSVVLKVLIWSENGEHYIPEWVLSFKVIRARRIKSNKPEVVVSNTYYNNAKWINESDPVTEKPESGFLEFDLESGILDGEENMIKLQAINTRGRKFKGKLKL